MRTYLFFAVLFGMFIFAIVAGYKPELIDKQYEQIKKPIAEHFAEKRAEAWQQAKDKEWEAWSAQLRTPSNCEKEKSAIKELECKNKWQLQAEGFEKAWNRKIASGWKPEGID